MFNNYKDFFDKLTNEEAGDLIKAIIDYSNYGETGYSFKSVKAECYFTVIKQHLDSNSEKYEKTVEKNKENVSKRWNTQQDTTVSFGINEDTKNTTSKNKIPKDTTVSSGIKSYSDNDNDKDNDSDNDIDIDNNKDISSEQQVATEPKTVQMK